MKTLMREAIGTSLNVTEREDGSIYTLEFVRNVYKNKALRKMELYDKLEIVQEIQINNTWFVLGIRIHLVEGRPFMIEKHLFNSNIEDVKESSITKALFTAIDIYINALAKNIKLTYPTTYHEQPADQIRLINDAADLITGLTNLGNIDTNSYFFQKYAA